MKVMQFVYKRPFETLVLLLVLYYSLIVFMFEPVSFSVKAAYIRASFGIWLVFLVFGFAFKKELESAKLKLFDIFFTKQFAKLANPSKIISLLKLSLPVFAVTSVLEYLITTVFVSGGSVAIGFPLSVYSFSADKFLFLNIIIDLLIHISILYFIGYILMKYEKKY